MSFKGEINISNLGIFNGSGNSVATVYNEIPILVGGSLGQIQYNDSGMLGGISGIITTGTFVKCLDSIPLNLDTNVSIQHSGTSGSIVSSIGDIKLENTNTIGDINCASNQIKIQNSASTNVCTISNTGLSTIGAVSSLGRIRGLSPGSIVNSVYLNNSDLSVGTFPIGPIEAAFLTYNYVPVSSNSLLKIMIDFDYTIDNSGADQYTVRIRVNGAIVTQKVLIYVNGPGGGTRSNTLSPVYAMYTNTDTTTKTITCTTERPLADDDGDIRGNNHVALIIQEIQM